jgi:hypothetical protein
MAAVKAAVAPLVAGQVHRLRARVPGRDPIEDRARVVTAAVVADDDLEPLDRGQALQVVDPLPDDALDPLGLVVGGGRDREALDPPNAPRS